MGNEIFCVTHGERQKAYVCSHLARGAAALGFNCGDPTADNPFPDAWCDDCELIRASHGGWNDESEKLLQISLVCSECYGRIRIRNTRTAITLGDLATLKWKCSSCEEWHSGPCLDFTYDSPIYWTKEHAETAHRAELKPKTRGKLYSAIFLDEDFCAIDDSDFFVRGLIKLPIIGTTAELCWGVWGSLSRQNFGLLMAQQEDQNRDKLPRMFSWLSNEIKEYPSTLNLKMFAHVHNPDERPTFELEPTEHPLVQEYYNGISPEKVKKIMHDRLREFA